MPAFRQTHSALTPTPHRQNSSHPASHGCAPQAPRGRAPPVKSGSQRVVVPAKKAVPPLRGTQVRTGGTQVKASTVVKAAPAAKPASNPFSFFGGGKKAREESERGSRGRD